MRRVAALLFVFGMFALIAATSPNQAALVSKKIERDNFCGSFESPYSRSLEQASQAIAGLVGSSSVAADMAEPVTFNNQVVRIFQKSCQVCHHPGDIAPFSLMTYRDARPYASLIRAKTETREMPPWKPVDGCGEFEGKRGLSEDEIATIARWVDEGAVEGDPADLPETLSFPDGWPLGQPDVILQDDEDYTVNPGSDIYRCFTLPTDLRGDRYISAVEIKPGNRNVVHHVILFIDETGISETLDARDPGPGYTSFGGPGFPATGTLGGWAPGARSRFEPDGTAWRLPAGARVVAQVHYHPRSEAAERDRTQIGLYFARQPVRKELVALGLDNDNFAIPANDANYKVTASFTVPPGANSHALAVFPHMHLLGHAMNVAATYPDGSSRCLIDIQDWNFNWQGLYYYKEPVPLPSGTRLSVTAFYDNSENNPRNPNSPPKVVRFGEKTTDEMCVAFIQLTLDADSREVSSPQVSSVAIDSTNRLMVTGRGFLKGADIEVNGQRLADTRNHKKKKKLSKELSSSEDWKSLIAPGAQVMITVLNTDGVRSASFSFTR